LKPVYKAPTEEAALTALDEFEAQWGKKYPLAVKSWRVNWNELATMNIVDKWTMPIWDWDLILNNLMIYF
jgi:transposase-like protein